MCLIRGNAFIVLVRSCVWTFQLLSAQQLKATFYIHHARKFQGDLALRHSEITTEFADKSKAVAIFLTTRARLILTRSFDPLTWAQMQIAKAGIQCLSMCCDCLGIDILMFPNYWRSDRHTTHWPLWNLRPFRPWAAVEDMNLEWHKGSHTRPRISTHVSRYGRNRHNPQPEVSPMPRLAQPDSLAQWTTTKSHVTSSAPRFSWLYTLGIARYLTATYTQSYH